MHLNIDSNEVIIEVLIQRWKADNFMERRLFCERSREKWWSFHGRSAICPWQIGLLPWKRVSMLWKKNLNITKILLFTFSNKNAFKLLHLVIIGIILILFYEFVISAIRTLDLEIRVYVISIRIIFRCLNILHKVVELTFKSSIFRVKNLLSSDRHVISST